MAWVVGLGIFLFLLFSFPRHMVGLLVLCGIVFGGFLLWINMQEKSRLRERARVSVTIAYDTERCQGDYPLFIGIVNRSGKTLEAVSFGVEGHRAEYSEPLYDSGYHGYSSDRIISSGDGWANCWSLPKQAYGASEQIISSTPLSALVWSTKNTSPRFRDD